MYKILLADDEGVSLASLRINIWDHFSDSCDIRLARNAKQIFDIFAKFIPDVMFINVQMTGIRGLFSIRELHSINRKCLFIVLSNTPRLDYHREGTNMGIIQYLTKPVSRKKSINALAEALKKIDHERNLIHQKQLNKEKLETVIPYIENGLMSQIIFSPADANTISLYRELLNIRADHGWIIDLLFCESVENGTIQNPVGSTVQLQKQIVLFRRIIRAFFPASITGPVLGNHVIILIPSLAESLTEKEDEFRCRRISSMLYQMGQKLNLTFLAGLSQVHPFSSISNALTEALDHQKEQLK